MLLMPDYKEYAGLQTQVFMVMMHILYQLSYLFHPAWSFLEEQEGPIAEEN